MKILNFGSLNIDSVYDVKHIVRPGETLAVISEKRFMGGKGFNQSVALARAGVHVCHAGCIGEDGEELKLAAVQFGIDIKHLRTVSGKTGQAIIQVDENGENSILVNAAANFKVSIQYIDEVLADFEKGDIILLQNEISYVDYLIDAAWKKGMKIVLNPSPFDESMQKIDLNKISYLILNETEAAQLSGSTLPMDFINMIKARYPKLCAVLTLGKMGCICVCDGEVYKSPAFKIKLADTTAAGDTFTGYFTAGISKYPIRENLRIANAAAALAVSKNGASASIPDKKSVLDALDSLIPYDGYCDTEYKLDLVFDYINTDMANASIAGLAKKLGYTPSYTGNWVSRHTGMPFSQLLQQKRCEAAAYYLEYTDMPINEIIRKIGYNNADYFRQIFNEKYHALPAQFRKLHKTEEEK